MTQHLQISSCTLLGWSGGGPYVLAMAHRFPQIIKKAAIIAGFSQPFDAAIRKKMYVNKWYFLTAQKFPFLLQKVLGFVRGYEVKKTISQRWADLPDADYALMKGVPQLKKLMAVTVQEALHNGSKGAVHEAALYSAPFGFSLNAITVPVHFWWGSHDRAVMYPHAKALEAGLPYVHPHYKPGEGHLSIYINHLNEILETLAGDTAVPESGSTEPVTIRAATYKDAALIAEMSRTTFYETFAPHNKKEDMEQFLREQFTTDKLIAETDAPENTFLIAYQENEPVGYVKLRDREKPAGLEAVDALEIARLYVATTKIGTGIGKALMQASLQTATRKGKKAVWLGVWEKNSRAIHFYHQWGFQKFSECNFRLGSDLQRDWLMKKEL